MTQQPLSFWGMAVDPLREQLESSPRGLLSDEAQKRLTLLAAGRLKPRRRSRLSILWAQFIVPIIWLLFCSAGLSVLLEDRTNAVIILAILVASSLLG